MSRFHSSKTIALRAALVAAPLLLATGGAFAQEAVKVGTLTCNVSSGLGLIITSKRTMNCTFASTNGMREGYRGSIRRFGLDIGATNRGVLVWGVLAPTNRPSAGALAGDYVGGAASASVGAGVGANALVGGFNRSFTLQPVSVEGQTGVNLALGVADLTLTSTRRAGRAQR